ncbi:MAG: iron ABC transporter permease [Malacoplasma sp.]
MKLNYKKKFVDYRINTNKKQYIFFALFLVLAFFFLFLVATVDQNGFANIDTVWRNNKRLIFIILISSFSLGVSSFLFQNLTKNKLADSSALGIGNINLVALMLLIYIVDYNSSYSVSNYKYLLPFIFIICSVLLSAAIYLLSSKRYMLSSKKLILTGILLNFVFIAVSYSFNSFLPSGKQAIVKQYTNGFYDSSDDYYMYVAFAFFVIAMIWIFCIINKFKITSSNAEVATQLGINVKSINFQALLIAGIMAGISFILIGNVAFLGLIGANAAIFLFKKNFKLGLPSSGYISTIIVALTFLINKNIVNSNVNTSQLIPLVSSVYFFYLVIRS